ncbi:MAG TPA: SGNH/GDSL hydrolase family protein [Ktedonobacteraceae bacterium]
MVHMSQTTNKECLLSYILFAILFILMACPHPVGATPARRSITGTTGNGQSLNYLALGDSLAAGTQSSPFQLCPSNTNCGYVKDLFSYLQSQQEFTEAKDLGCTVGETSTTFLNSGGPCSDKTSQLTRALDYIHKGNVGLVTLHIGADDLLPNIKYSSKQKTCQTDQTGFHNDLQTLEHNLPQILKPLHDALNGSGQLMLLNYYDPFQKLCPETVQYVQQLNNYLATAIQPYGSLVDIFSDFNQNLCTYTGMCKTTINPSLDIHPTAKGYQAIANAIEKVLNLRVARKVLQPSLSVGREVRKRIVKVKYVVK